MARLRFPVALSEASTALSILNFRPDASCIFSTNDRTPAACDSFLINDAAAIAPALTMGLNGRMVVGSSSMELNASPLGSTPTRDLVPSRPNSSSANWNANGLQIDWIVNSFSQSPAQKTCPSTVVTQIPKSLGSALLSSGM